MHFVPFFPVPFFPCAFFSCAIFSCAFFSGAIFSYTRGEHHVLESCKGERSESRLAELIIVSWQHWVRRLERDLSVARSTRARYVNCHSAAGNSLVEAVCLKADLVGSLCYICCCCSGRVVVSGQLPPSHGRGCHSPQILSNAAANQADGRWDQPATWPVRGWPMGKHLPCSGWRLPSQPSRSPSIQ